MLNPIVEAKLIDQIKALKDQKSRYEIDQDLLHNGHDPNEIDEAWTIVNLPTPLPRRFERLRWQKLSKLGKVLVIIMGLLLFPTLLRVAHDIDYGLPIVGDIPDVNFYYDKPFWRDGCKSSEDGLGPDCFFRESRCFTESYLIEQGNWPLVEVSSYLGAAHPFLATYRIVDGKKELNLSNYNQVYIRYGSMCYISYRTPWGG